MDRKTFYKKIGLPPNGIVKLAVELLEVRDALQDLDLSEIPEDEQEMALWFHHLFAKFPKTTKQRAIPSGYRHVAESLSGSSGSMIRRLVRRVLVEMAARI